MAGEEMGRAIEFLLQDQPTLEERIGRTQEQVAETQPQLAETNGLFADARRDSDGVY